MVRGAMYGRTAAAEGSTAEVACRAEAAPSVWFRWSTGGVQLDNATDADKYQIIFSQVSYGAFHRPRNITEMTRFVRSEKADNAAANMPVLLMMRQLMLCGLLTG